MLLSGKSSTVMLEDLNQGGVMKRGELAVSQGEVVNR